MSERVDTVRLGWYLTKMLPAWTRRAVCAGKAPNRAPYEPMFKDGLSRKAHIKDYHWPATVKEAIRTCARCPVRQECLDYALQGEAGNMDLGMVPVRTTHLGTCAWFTYPERIRIAKEEGDVAVLVATPPPRCPGCKPKEEQISTEPMTLTLRPPSGVYGGVPGRIREALAFEDCPTCSGQTYVLELPGLATFGSFAWAYPEGTPGFPCTDCDATGRVPSPDAVANCTAWFDRYVEKERMRTLDRKDRMSA